MVVRITVTAVSDDTPPNVTFETSLGTGAGCWAADPPTAGRGYDVEIEVEDELAWGQQIRLASGDEISLSIVDGLVVVRALYQPIDDDVASLSLGNSIVMIEVTGAPPGVQSEVLVELRLEKQMVRLFPYEL
jgi:hypothetical protein